MDSWSSLGLLVVLSLEPLRAHTPSLLEKCQPSRADLKESLSLSFCGFLMNPYALSQRSRIVPAHAPKRHNRCWNGMASNAPRQKVLPPPSQMVLGFLPGGLEPFPERPHPAASPRWLRFLSRIDLFIGGASWCPAVIDAPMPTRHSVQERKPPRRETPDARRVGGDRSSEPGTCPEATSDGF